MTEAPPARDAYARLVLETMPLEARLGFFLGYLRTFGVPAIAEVLYGTGRMVEQPRARAKATGAAMFALIARGPHDPEGRRIADELRRVHRRPGITPELMHYVLACFVLCPVRFVDAHGPRAVTGEERAAAFAVHRELGEALGLPEQPWTGLDAVESWMREFEVQRFGLSEAGHALWTVTAPLALGTGLPAPLARLVPVVAASLLDEPLRAALGARRPPAPVRALVELALRTRARRAHR